MPRIPCLCHNAVAIIAGAVAASGTLTPPASAAVVYVSSLNSHEVLRYDAGTGVYIDTFISAVSGGLDLPHGIVQRCDDVLVCSFGSDEVLRYDRDTGAFLDVFIDNANGLTEPTYIQYGPDGMLYVSSQGSDEIHRYTDAGVFVDAFVAAGSGGLDGPSGFAFGPDGRLYVAGRYSANVIAYDAASGAFDEIIADDTDGLGFGNTFGLNFGGNGDMYFASNGNVYHYDLDTASIVNTIAMAFPIGVDPDAGGDVFVGTSSNLRRIDVDDDSASGLYLTGGAISTLNFFHFPEAWPGPDCTGSLIPAASTWAAVWAALILLAAATICFRRDRSTRHWGTK